MRSILSSPTHGIECDILQKTPNAKSCVCPIQCLPSSQGFTILAAHAVSHKNSKRRNTRCFAHMTCALGDSVALQLKTLKEQTCKIKGPNRAPVLPAKFQMGSAGAIGTLGVRAENLQKPCGLGSWAHTTLHPCCHCDSLVATFR